MKKLAKIMIIGLLIMSLTACGGKKAPVNQQAAELEKSIKKDGLTEENMQKLMELADAVAENESSQITVTPPASAPTETVVAPPASTTEEQKKQEELGSTNGQMVPIVTDDRMKMLEVFDTAEGIFFLEQNGHLYTLNGYTALNIPIEYDIGMPIDISVGTDLRAGVLLYNGFFSPQGELEGIFSYGDVPVYSVDKTKDKVIAYSQDIIPDLVLREVVFTGYTIGVNTDMYGHTSVCHPERRSVYALADDIDIQVRDSDGNIIEYYRDLVYGEEYTAFWTEGTRLIEASLPATAKVYKYVSEYVDTKADFLVPGVPTAEGYAVYDLSTIPKGLYRADGMVIEIL